MARIFISYRRVDSSSLATLIALSLKQHKIDAFVDTRSIDGGGPFPDRLRRAIEEADIFVCLLGATTLDSEWVREEIEHAHNLRKILIPVFQERYAAPNPIPNKHIEALLQSDGIHMLDVRNLFIDAAIADLAKMIRGSPKPRQTTTPRPRRAIAVAGAVIIVIGVLVLLNALTQRQPQNVIGIDTSPTAVESQLTEISDTPSITARPTDTTEPTRTQTSEPTDTPTATNTPTQVSPFELARQAVTQNADWTPYFEMFDGVEMALVPLGCFDMGENGEGGRQCFDEPFWIDRYEVTNEQYKRCVAAGECTPPSDTTYYDDPTYADHPVVYVDWYQANAYAEWRNGRLPTEAEWEYAARGPDGLVYPWGDDFDGARLNFCDENCVYDLRDANYDDGYERTAPVGSYPAGASWVGALDLSGNVWEWTSTIYEGYPYVVDDGREDQDRTDVFRVLRGGSWLLNLVNARAAYRYNLIPFPVTSMSVFVWCVPLLFELLIAVGAVLRSSRHGALATMPAYSSSRRQASRFFKHNAGTRCNVSLREDMRRTKLCRTISIAAARSDYKGTTTPRAAPIM